MSEKRTAVITGASSGIGEATARALAADGWRVVLGARREERLERVARECGGEAHRLDVTDPESVAEFAAKVPGCALLVNNAGGAKGKDSIADADEAEWEWMFQANVMGTLRLTRALLPKLIASGDGMVVNIVSIAGWEPYAGGAGYNAAKFGQRALTSVLRQELLGEPVRVTEIDPGMVVTEFSEVRFHGDKAAADAVYQGMTPLTAGDVAECIRWTASLPPRVNIDVMRVMPRDQASATLVHREG